MEVKFEELIGKHVLAVWMDDDQENIFFVTANKSGVDYIRSNELSLYLMAHDQDGCEYVRVEDIDNDLKKMIGATIVSAETAYQHKELSYTSMTWTFYKLATDKGDYFTIRWLGESNGYYSEGVDFYRLLGKKPRKSQGL